MAVVCSKAGFFPVYYKETRDAISNLVSSMNQDVLKACHGYGKLTATNPFREQCCGTIGNSLLTQSPQASTIYTSGLFSHRTNNGIASTTGLKLPTIMQFEINSEMHCFFSSCQKKYLLNSQIWSLMKPANHQNSKYAFAKNVHSKALIAIQICFCTSV